MTAALLVLDPGPLGLVQDEGRTGYAAMGVSPSGAADRTAYRRGQRLVGDLPGGAALELLLGGLTATARGELTVAVTGAPASLRVGDRPVPHATPVAVHDGETIELGMPPTGLRSYLAVRGGIAVDPVLGSRSTDTLAGLGPPPLRAGDVLPIGATRHGSLDLGGLAGQSDRLTVVGGSGADAGLTDLEVLTGPRTDWLADPGDLERSGWTVGPASDRVGLRLVGTPLARVPARRGAEVPSEGLVRGAVQLPPDGLPVVLLADHPVTGGYPVVGVLARAAADRAAQLRPGDRVRLAWRA